MAALPPHATIYANTNSNPASNSSSPTSAAASASSASSTASSRSTTPPSTASSRLRSFFGHSPPQHSAGSAAAADSDVPRVDTSLGHIGAPAAHDGYSTHTYTEQAEVERRVDAVLSDYLHYPHHHSQPPHRPPQHQPHLPPPSTPTLTLRHATHVQYLLRALDLLPTGYTALDSSRPWLVYWTLQSLSVLGHVLPTALASRCVAFLRRCWVDGTGGFAGGPGQDAHIAPTYAAVNALCLLACVDGVGVEAALGWMDRRLMHSFLLRMKQADGSFAVCIDGECDTRGVYTAIAVASLLNLLSPQLTANTPAYLAACQTYEGGMGGEPGNEAHGGYTFCAVAALLMLRAGQLVSMERVRQWAVRRQMRREGGFCGRTNKLVDGCYSWWVGALIPLLQLTHPPASTGTTTAAASATNASMIDPVGLQRYVLLCGQSGVGGLRDKPGKGPDLYHTCYCLSGLSVAQWLHEDAAHSGDGGGGAAGVEVLGGVGNRLRRVNVLYGIGIEEAERALEYCGKLPAPDETWR